MRSLFKIVKNIFSGAVVGVANVIPGVSGGTMAVVLNVFDQMMEALGLKKFRKNRGFLLTFGLGAILGILAFSSAIKWLLEYHPTPTNFTFIGLIIGSIPMIFSRAKGKEPVRFGNILAFLIGLTVMVVLALVNQNDLSSTRETALTLTNGLWLFAVGALASVAMILPGISGSLILMIFGTYYTIIGSIGDTVSGLLGMLKGTNGFEPVLQNVLLLIPAGIGILLGLVFGSRLIDYVIKKFPRVAYSAIFGLVIGSFAALFPRNFLWNGEGILSIVLLLAGTAAAYCFSRSAKN